MKKNKRRLPHHPSIRREDDPAKISEMLAPAEEQEQKAVMQQGKNGGAIIVDASSVNISRDLSGDNNTEGYILGLHPIVIVIVIAALLFISFIAWRITLMEYPAK